LEGAVVSGRTYDPVLRESPTGTDSLTWGEFVEAGFLNEYRASLSLQRMRLEIAGLRATYDTPYPLALKQPLVDISNRVLTLPEGDGYADSLSGQTRWPEAAEKLLRKVEFDAGGAALRYMPLGTDHLVAIDPRVTFGIPQVRGIRTDSIAESLEEFGEDLAAVAQEWGLSEREVKAAIEWESRVAA